MLVATSPWVFQSICFIGSSGEYPHDAARGICYGIAPMGPGWAAGGGPANVLRNNLRWPVAAKWRIGASEVTVWPVRHALEKIGRAP